MSAALLPDQFDTLLTLYRQVKLYHPESTNSFMAIKNHANAYESKLRKKFEWSY
jgi:hypothetical protein